MLQEFFNYDNPVWRFIGKFFDIFLLNILWMVCCILVVTAGAATTAVYYVTMKLVRDEDGSTIRQYFKSFKENFKQATAIWLILLAVLAVIGFDLYFAVMLPSETPYRTVMMAVFVGFAVIWSAISLYVAPLQATFYNPVKRTIFNAFFISIRHFPATLGMLVIDWAIPLTAFMAAAFLQPVIFIFGFPLVAFLNSFVMVGIFQRYMPKENHEEQEDQEEV
ncbi:MAG: YesL family protein [Clostridiales bacterium]|nr:YesL family protein [Clostridiales bacterium]